MRSFFVLICSLALAYAVCGETTKNHDSHASQHTATHQGHSSGGNTGSQHAQAPQHPQASQHPQAFQRSQASQHAQAPQQVIAPVWHPTGSGQHFEQTNGSQRFAAPQAGALRVAPVVQQPPETAAPTTGVQSNAPAPTREQLEETYARSQGFRSAEQYRRWQETGRVEIPAGVATVRMPTAGGRPGSDQKIEHGVTDSALPSAIDKAKTSSFRPQHFDLPNKPTPEIAPAKFQQNRRISESDQWVGPKYQVFRNYRCEWHDRDWWRHHHSRIAFAFGGSYYWNAGYWFPAWGYDSTAYYPYDGPIYAYNDLSPDQTIANVQAALQALGYYQGPINGILDPLTRIAIADYQRDQGLYVTSAIDEATIASLGMA